MNRNATAVNEFPATGEAIAAQPQWELVSGSGSAPNDDQLTGWTDRGILGGVRGSQG